ncbi:hypothetical protein KCP78_04295 [Salmonella enterica subsp. enterica]|nr:hypothetical protein KCP78_04295 [Salmonella enterica subsp. enterica]
MQPHWRFLSAAEATRRHLRCDTRTLIVSQRTRRVRLPNKTRSHKLLTVLAFTGRNFASDFTETDQARFRRSVVCLTCISHGTQPQNQ